MENNFKNLKENSLAFYRKSDCWLWIKEVVFFIPIIFLGTLTMSCHSKNNDELISSENQRIVELKIPDLNVEKEQIEYNNKTSTYSYNNKPFSGYMVSFYKDGMLKEKTGIYDGQKQNLSSIWFRDGKQKQIATYEKGKLHGAKKLWTNDSIHTLIAHFNYRFGKPDGVQKQWYETGELFKILNLKMGKEDGIQRAFRKNGDLYANYEAKNGRIFGLKKTALCYGLADEKLENYEK